MNSRRTVNLKKKLRNIRLNIRYAFRLHKPLLTLRLAKTMIGVYLFNKRPLRYVDIAIHYGCNLSCEHCFATQLQHNGRASLKLDDYRAFAKQAMREGAVNFSFQGGEPTANVGNLIAIIKQFSPDRNLISVTTNGTLLDAEKVQALRNAGVDILTISLDSGIAEEHDAFRRQPGTFAAAMSVITLARKAGMNVTLGATVSHDNLYTPGIKRLIEFAADNSLILFLSLAAPAGEWCGNSGVLLSEEDIAYITELENTHPYIRTDFRANWKHHGCGAIKEILYMTPYGDVFPCPFLHFSIGNINEETLKSVRARGCQLDYFKEYHPKCLCAEDQQFITSYMPEISEHTRKGHYVTAEELFASKEAAVRTVNNEQAANPDYPR
jgi:MoaA/NifB/PqqE/SkfB family radical SAM enzyme